MSFTPREDPTHQTWVKSNFKYSKSDDSLFFHQKIVRDYMKIDTPFRGILLYHGLGTGKTLSSIAISQGFKDAVVLLPATLEGNFLKEIEKFKANGIPMSNNIQILKYNGITKNKLATLPTDMFDNKVVIVDEVHNFISRVTNGSYVSKHIYKMIYEAKNIKLVCLSGTPLINYPQEFALLMNFIAGPMTVHTVKLLKNNVLTEIEKDPHVKSIKLKSNGRAEIALIEDRFIKNGKQLLRSTQPPPSIESLLEKYKIKIGSQGIRTQRQPLFPLNEKQFMNLVNTDYDFIRSQIGGLVSYFKYYDPKLYPKQSELQIVHVKMTDSQFEAYKKARKLEYDQENPDNMFIKKKLYKKMFDQDKSDDKELLYFKVYSRIALNSCLAATTATSDNFAKDAPKMREIVKKLKTANGPSVIYSQYRNLGGIGTMARVLQHYGIEPITIKNNAFVAKASKQHFIVFPTDNKKNAELFVKLFNKEIKDDRFNIACILITQAGSEGISLKGVRQVHILDPYWNYVRINQIIGRAVRAYSHVHLPKAEQNVDTFIYLSKFANKEQIHEMAWDKGKLSKIGCTSDEIVYDIALKKQNILDNLLNIMKEVAMDCKVHLKMHHKNEPDLKCVGL